MLGSKVLPWLAWTAPQAGPASLDSCRHGTYIELVQQFGSGQESKRLQQETAKVQHQHLHGHWFVPTTASPAQPFTLGHLVTEESCTNLQALADAWTEV